MSKVLVAFFSASGSTSKLASTLAAAANADLYEIRPAVPYERKDLNWMDKKARTTVEMQDPNCRPAMVDSDAPIAASDVVFLGFPIWWYREPSIIDSFLDAYDFSGKTVIPFFTSGGSQLGELFRPRFRIRAEELDQGPSAHIRRCEAPLPCKQVL